MQKLLFMPVCGWREKSAHSLWGVGSYSLALQKIFRLGCSWWSLFYVAQWRLSSLVWCRTNGV